MTREELHKLIDTAPDAWEDEGHDQWLWQEFSLTAQTYIDEHCGRHLPWEVARS